MPADLFLRRGGVGGCGGDEDEPRLGSGISLSGWVMFDSISFSQYGLLHASFSQYLNDPQLSINVIVALPTISTMFLPYSSLKCLAIVL